MRWVEWSYRFCWAPGKTPQIASWNGEGVALSPRDGNAACSSRVMARFWRGIA
jgi:hypothetical protein